MKLLFHPAALNEMIDAANYYEHQRDGLGGEFDVAIEAAFAAILENPQRWPIVFPNVNRYRLKRFPFGIFYRSEGNQ
jgi:toxin ParE1/3/4